MRSFLALAGWVRAAAEPIVARWLWWSTVRVDEQLALSHDEAGLFPTLRGSA